jgi:hypothetical protein
LSECSSICDGAVRAAVTSALPYESEARIVEQEQGGRIDAGSTGTPVSKGLCFDIVYDGWRGNVQQLVVGAHVHAHGVTVAVCTGAAGGGGSRGLVGGGGAYNSAALLGEKNHLCMLPR